MRGCLKNMMKITLITKEKEQTCLEYFPVKFYTFKLYCYDRC